MRLATPAVLAALLCLARAARADEAAPWAAQGAWWAVGGQFTAIGQTNTVSSGPHTEDLSFGFKPSIGWSTTATLQGALKLWKGADVALMGEWADGRGLPNASGLGGYVNGDLERVAKVGATPYIARAFIHQDIPLGPEPEKPEPPTFEARFSPSGPHLFQAGAPTSRIELTLGKFCANDFFDASPIGSDTRHRFMNWAIWEQGSWDFAADTRGYTWGVVADVEQPRWAARLGVMLMPTAANGADFDLDLLHAHSLVAEVEGRWTIKARPGSLKLLGYGNWARMGNYREAIAAAGPSGIPDIDSVARPGALKYGFGLLLDQEIISELHIFARVGANDGQTETFVFTEIDRSANAGGEVSGALWSRPSDRAGLGFAVSGLSPAHADYLARGGRGFQLGDGSLASGVECIGELYYVFSPIPYVEVSADVQGIANPGMNRERGPAAVFGLRLHLHV